MPYKVYLKKNEEKRILKGHPWVYANEVQRIEGDGKNGDLAAVYSCSGRYIGKGYINHLSKILVRIFIRDDSEPDENFFYERIKKADEYRRTLGFDDCYRAVFAEADGLPGLIVDRYHDLLCTQFLSLGMEKQKQTILNCLIKHFNPRGIYERSDAAVRSKEGLSPAKGVLYGEFEPRVVINENGLKLIADLENGQKTGYFLDQKENRYAIRRYARGGTMLDCFCNVGGFSLNAAAAGATEVTALDISQKALDDVRENARLNGLEDKITTLCGDVFEELRRFKREGKQFNTVVLDPPAFCKSLAEVKDAYRGYRDINLLGMKLVKSGGYLVTASCSHYMSFSLFGKMLREAAAESGRTVRLCELRTQSPDHPASLAEEESTYLKFYILQISD